MRSLFVSAVVCWYCVFFCDFLFYEISLCLDRRFSEIVFCFPLECVCVVQNSEFLRSRCRREQTFEERGELYGVSLCFDGRLWVSLFLWDSFLMYSKEVVNSWETEVGVNRILRIKESSANFRCVLTFVLRWRFPLVFFFVVVSSRAFMGSRGRRAQNLENWGYLCEILW